MDKKDFYFDLPDHLIAQTPLDRRDSSRLLCMSRYPSAGETGTDADGVRGDLRHMFFCDLPRLLRSGDCLVLNDSRVLPARLNGFDEKGKAVEVLLLKEYHGSDNDTAKDTAESSGDMWECLVYPGRSVKPGVSLTFGAGELTASVSSVLPDGNRVISFYCETDFAGVLVRLGKMPLPPYIKKTLDDPGRYQTVYSRIPGSAAAPTAGLHFTEGLLRELEGNGINICYITLHVGPGTFRPVKTDKIEEHIMHSEVYSVSDKAASIINQAKEAGGRIIAVGTTSCRVLETVADKDGRVAAGSGDTDIFIYPGYEFKCIDGLITNFHLPESTLLMLVSALAGRERVLEAYKTAKEKEYRFFSFGDAMLIL